MATIGGGTTGAIGGAASGAMAGAALGPIGMGVGAVLGGIFGSKGVSAPAPPSYRKVMTNALKAQEGIQGRLIQLERQYRPQWQGLTEGTYETQLYGGKGTKGYLSMLGELQGELRGLQEQSVIGNLGLQARLSSIARQQLLSPQQQALRQGMLSTGLTAAAAGRNLSVEQLRESQQAARAAMAARGLGGRQAVAAEVLNRNALADAREARNLQIAQGAMQMESGIQQMALQQANTGMGLIGQTGQFMGASSMLGDYQSKVFQPESQMAAQLAGAQYQHGMSMAQSQLAQRQGMMQALGSFGAFAAMNPGMFSFGSNSSGIEFGNPNAGLGANPQFGMIGEYGQTLPMSPANAGGMWGVYGG